MPTSAGLVPTPETVAQSMKLLEPRCDTPSRAPLAVSRPPLLISSAPSPVVPKPAPRAPISAVSISLASSDCTAGQYTEMKNYIDSFARAELAYDVMLEGLQRLRKLSHDYFYEALDKHLFRSAVLNSWATVVLFDGLRPAGLEVAANVALLEEHQRAPWAGQRPPRCLAAARPSTASAWAARRSSSSLPAAWRWKYEDTREYGPRTRAAGRRLPCVLRARAGAGHPRGPRKVPGRERDALPRAGQVDARDP